MNCRHEDKYMEVKGNIQLLRREIVIQHNGGIRNIYHNTIVLGKKSVQAETKKRKSVRRCAFGKDSQSGRLPLTAAVHCRWRSGYVPLP